jgi:uncharacterized protein with PIN domain
MSAEQAKLEPEVGATSRWIAGSALELVARRLRALGFDVEPGGESRLEDLISHARALDRGVLTTSARRPRAALGVRVLTVPRDPRAGVRMIARAAVPASAPFTRCTVCNHTLEAADTTIASAVPADVRAAGHAVRHCPRCDRYYWPGSHTDRLRHWLEAVLDHPVEGP